MRTCKTCKVVKPLTDFYLQPGGKDGRHTECKECRKTAVRARYRVTRVERSTYERQRNQTPERKKQVAECQRRRRLREPQKDKARTAVHNAIRDGRLTRCPCEVCGSPKVQAHHDDYSRPLDVRWFCFKHHRETAHGQVVVSHGGAPGGLVDKEPLRIGEPDEAPPREGREAAVA